MLIGVERCVYSRQAKVSSYGFPNETSRLNEQVRRTARITEPVTVCQRMLRGIQLFPSHSSLLKQSLECWLRNPFHSCHGLYLYNLGFGILW